jgi:23S rRNA pseudouridine1911/1915/1917 synthase
MNILFEDKEKLILNKEPGVLTQSDKSFDRDLVSEVLAYRVSKGEEAYAAVVNRLDRPVSGLVLMAKTKNAAGKYNKYMKENSFNKMYYAIVCGRLDKPEGTFTDYLLKDGRTNTSSPVPKDTKQAKYAELEYSVIREKEFFGIDGECIVLSLVRIHLITGRHHQIRVQFASRGLPLLGDTKYGKDVKLYSAEKEEIQLIKRRETALCAYSLTVDGRCWEIGMPWGM